MPDNKPFNIGIRLEEVKVQVKFTLKQSMNSQRWSTGTALLFLLCRR
jgi:hypothetical protein